MCIRDRSIAQQQKLELIRTKFEIAGSAPEGLVSRSYIRKSILELSDDQISGMIKERIADTDEDKAVEAGSGGGDEGGEEGGDEGGGDEGGGDLFSADQPEGPLLIGDPKPRDSKDALDDDEDEDVIKLSIDDVEAPVKAHNKIRNIFNEPLEKKRKVTAGPNSTHMPDFKKMTGVGSTARKQDSLSKPFDNDFIGNPFKESSLPRNEFIDKFLDDKITQRTIMTKQMNRTLSNMSSAIGITRQSILSEDVSEDQELDIDLIEESKNDEQES